LFFIGRFIAAAGFFLPGIFDHFFVIPFLGRQIKKTPAEAALGGYNASSCGMLISAGYLKL